MGAANLTDQGLAVRQRYQGPDLYDHQRPQHVMPAWGKRLDPETIKSLAVYVHSLGGGK